MTQGKIVCRTTEYLYVGVDYNRATNEFFYWQYPYNMREWEGFIGQWRLKRIKN